MITTVTLITVLLASHCQLFILGRLYPRGLFPFVAVSAFVSENRHKRRHRAPKRRQSALSVAPIGAERGAIWAVAPIGAERGAIRD